MSKQKNDHYEQTENVYLCGMCFEQFSDEQLCYNHVISHSRKDKQSHTVATDTGGLQETHTEIRNEKLKNAEHKSIKCDCCEKYFPNKLKLRHHLLQCRTGAEFQCAICNLVCRKWSQFKTHMRIHSNHRPFRCDLCLKAFKRNTHLVQHRKLHTGEKPFKCSLCKAAFADKCNLNRHLKLHPKQSSKTLKKFRSRRSRVPVIEKPVIHEDENSSVKTYDGGFNYSGNVPHFDLIEDTSTQEDSDVTEPVSSGKELILDACTALLNLNKDICEKEDTGETSTNVSSADSENMIVLKEEDRMGTAYMRIGGHLFRVVGVLNSKSPFRTDDADAVFHRKSDESEDSNLLLSQKADNITL